MNQEDRKKQTQFLDTLKFNKNVLFFSDFHLLKESLLLSSFLSHYWRLFKVISPIDEGFLDSISIYSGSNSKKRNLVVFVFNIKRKNGYLKNLDIRDDYLKEFLKEMS